MRMLILGFFVAAVFGSDSIPAAAHARVDFYVNVAPPPVPVEVVPAPRYGHVWVPGYWDWRYARHYWVPGHWRHARHGYYYAPARWVERDGRWYYARPGWYR